MLEFSVLGFEVELSPHPVPMAARCGPTRSSRGWPRAVEWKVGQAGHLLRINSGPILFMGHGQPGRCCRGVGGAYSVCGSGRAERSRYGPQPTPPVMVAKKLCTSRRRGASPPPFFIPVCMRMQTTGRGDPAPWFIQRGGSARGAVAGTWHGDVRAALLHPTRGHGPTDTAHTRLECDTRGCGTRPPRWWS